MSARKIPRHIQITRFSRRRWCVVFPLGTERGRISDRVFPCRFRCLAVLLLLLLGLGSDRVAEAGPWTQDVGVWQLILTGERYESDEYWDDAGTLRDAGGRFTKNEGRLYVEYGWNERNTLLLEVPYTSVEKDRRGMDGLSGNGVGDVKIGWRGRLFRTDWETASWQIMVGLAAYDAEVPLPLGLGRTFVDLRYLWGRTWPRNGGYAYLAVEAGGRFFEGDEPAQFRLEAIWYHPFSAAWGVALAVNGVESRFVESRVDASGSLMYLGHNRWKVGVGPVLDLGEGKSLKLTYWKDLSGSGTGKGASLEFAFAMTLGRN